MKGLGKIARKFGLTYLRIFGSSLSRVSPRDADLVVGPRLLRPDERDALSDALAKVVGRPVDIVQLRAGLGPSLVEVIGRESQPVWEARNGRADYAVLIDRYLAIAQDERLSFPPALRRLAARNVARRLRVP